MAETQYAEPTAPVNYTTPSREVPPTPMPVVVQPQPETTLYSWQAPSRLFKRRTREFYTTVGALVLLLSIILLIAREFLLIGVILSLGFVSYVLNSVPPDMLEYKLTNKGVRTPEKFYPWGLFGRYWWDVKWHQTFITIETPGRIPTTLTILVGNGNKEEIDLVVKARLINEKPKPTWFDNAAKWLQDKVPLESE